MGRTRTRMWWCWSKRPSATRWRMAAGLKCSVWPARPIRRESQVQAAIRGILEISKLNLTGRGDSLSLKLRGSTIEDRALLGYKPSEHVQRPTPRPSGFCVHRKNAGHYTFTETRYEGSLQLNDQVTPRTSLLYTTTRFARWWCRI